MQALSELSACDRRHVFVSADSLKAARATSFQERWPERTIETGIAEQGALDVAAGLATVGLIPYVVTYAGFITMRACEQMRTFIAYPDLPVRLVGLNGGLIGGEREGVTHQFYEDLAITRAVPGMTVISAADADDVYQATLATADIRGPVYMRLGSGREPVAAAALPPFELSKVRTLVETGHDVALFTTGFILNRVLDSAAQLQSQGIGSIVVDVSTIKPLDRAGIVTILRRVRAAVTIEDHSIIGGLGSALAELACEQQPLPLRRIGLADVFARSGQPEVLLDAYGLSADAITAAAKQMLAGR